MRGGGRYALVAAAGGTLLDALLATVSFSVRGESHYRELWAEGEPCIFVLWHGRLLPLTYLHRNQGIATMASRSEDGEYIARILRRWGCRPVRGSSSRGGDAALRELVRHARDGHSLAFTPDGPRGPRQRMKPGALVAARLTGLPIVPMAAGTDRAWWFESWDRFLVPKPFARVRVRYGPPRRIARDASDAEIEAHAGALESELNRLMNEVDRGDGFD